MVTESDKRIETANEPVSTDAELDAFWTENRLLHRKAELAAFLGTETLQDLNDVLPRDMKTMRFTMWAENTLTIAEANRLRRSIFAFHAKHNPRADQFCQPAHTAHNGHGGGSAPRT